MGRLTKHIKTQFPKGLYEGIEIDSEWGKVDFHTGDEWYDVIEKLAHYEDLEEQGRLIEQKHGYWETVVEVKDNTVCGNGVKIEYKRCSCCKNPAKFFEDDFCGNCGAKLDLPQPPKGE